MRKVFKAVDTTSEWLGIIARVFTVALVIVMVTEVTMRYVFNHPTMWAYETSIMLGCALYAMGYSYVERHNAHVRVDVFYTKLSPRGRAIIDVIGGILVFVPLIAVVNYAAISWMIKAWKIKEKMFESFWFPPAYPLRTVVAIGFAMLAIQGLVRLCRNFYLMIRNKNYD